MLPGESHPRLWRRSMTTLEAHQRLRRLSSRLVPSIVMNQQDHSSVIYCSRASRHALHGRRVPKAHEASIIEMISSHLGKSITVTGREREAEQPSLRAQAKLFAAATLVIGPHGGALTNVLWMRDGASLIEFVCSPRSVAVQDTGCPWARSMLYMMAGAAWLRVHVVPFAANSTARASYVDLRELALALRAAAKYGKRR